jgi:hypothetical protein
VTTAVSGHPLDWHLHVVWLLAIVALIAGYVRLTWTLP